MGWAEDAPPAGEVQQLRELLNQGFYNSAARLNAPELVAKYPSSWEVRALFARALFLTGELEGARAELDAAWGLVEGRPPELLNLWGLVLVASGDVEGGLPALREAFESSGRYVHAMDWGRAAWQSGAFEEALGAFGAAAGTDRGRLELWPLIDRGRLLILLGRLDEAVVSFDAAIDLFEAIDPGNTRPPPAYVEAFFRLGEVMELRGDLVEAEVNYRAARSADPNYAPAIQALDRLLRVDDGE